MRTSLAVLLSLALAGCTTSSAGEHQAATGPMIDPGAEDAEPVQELVAVLHPTEGHEVRGTVRFEQGKKRVKVHSEVTGLSEGGHGYHVHLFGDCTAADGTSAGTHYNFDGPSMTPPEDIDRITGNLGVLEAGADGTATHDAKLERAHLTGPKGILGRAVIVHARPNDPEQPPIGAAGARLACGVIGIANPD